MSTRTPRTPPVEAYTPPARSRAIARRLLAAAESVAPRAPQRIDLGNGLVAEVHTRARRLPPLRERRPRHLALVGARPPVRTPGDGEPAPLTTTTDRRAA